MVSCPFIHLNFPLFTKNYLKIADITNIFTKHKKLFMIDGAIQGNTFRDLKTSAIKSHLSLTCTDLSVGIQQIYISTFCN